MTDAARRLHRKRKRTAEYTKRWCEDTLRSGRLEARKSTGSICATSASRVLRDGLRKDVPMPTDEERREVARRLRSFVTDDSMYATVDASNVLYVLGLHYADIDRIYFCGYDVARLADLVEPSCGRDALLKVADMLECDGECSECECGKGTFCEAPTITAARIREALGENQ